MSKTKFRGVKACPFPKWKHYNDIRSCRQTGLLLLSASAGRKVQHRDPPESCILTAAQTSQSQRPTLAGRLLSQGSSPIGARGAACKKTDAQICLLVMWSLGETQVCTSSSSSGEILLSVASLAKLLVVLFTLPADCLAFLQLSCSSPWHRHNDTAKRSGWLFPDK